MSFFLSERLDFERHNQAVRELWKDYREGRRHRRVPVVVYGSIRNLFSNPELNDTGFSFQDFFTSGEAQLRCQVAYQDYCRHHLLCDQEMGLPAESWRIERVDFQNSYDAAWFGAPLVYFEAGDVPDTLEILKDDPYAWRAWGDLDPFWGRGDFIRRVYQMWEEVHERCRSGFEHRGRPVVPPPGLPAMGCGDGVFTLGCKLRGTVEFITDMMTDTANWRDLMDYLTRHVIARVKRHREFTWDHDPQFSGSREHRRPFYFSDDSIALLSREQYREYVYPYHRRTLDELSDGANTMIHLCGDATRHYKFMADAFGVKEFDTGFPVDHGALRRELGPDIRINGGPTIMLVRDGPPAAIDAEVQRICSSGVMDGGLFVLIAANNLAPCTPVENVVALYEAAKRHGRYDRGDS